MAINKGNRNNKLCKEKFCTSNSSSQLNHNTVLSWVNDTDVYFNFGRLSEQINQTACQQCLSLKALACSLFADTDVKKSKLMTEWVACDGLKDKTEIPHSVCLLTGNGAEWLFGNYFWFLCFSLKVNLLFFFMMLGQNKRLFCVSSVCHRGSAFGSSILQCHDSLC